MAKHLVAKGHSVVGYDPNTPEAGDLGIELRPSPASVASTTELIFIVVGFDEEVLQACLGPDGVLAGAKPGTVLVVCSTVRVQTVAALRAPASEAGVELLDAPLCRAEHAAVAGDLLVLVGGDQETYVRAEPAMQAFATDIAYLGPLGAGQIGKMVNNYLLWATVVANYEGLRLGQAAGLELEPLRRALLVSSAANWALETWPKGRPMPWAEKDMQIFLDQAEQLSLGLPMAGLVRGEITDLRARKEEWRTMKGVPSGGDADSMLAYMSDTPP